MTPQLHELTLPVANYDLKATLESGQAFRWRSWADPQPGAVPAWEGVIGPHWTRLTQRPDGIHATTALPPGNWQWLTHYLQTDINLESVLRTFPDDLPMRESVNACRGLRLLRQDPWECLASFILSSTKQIVQIKQIISLLCERFGTPIPVPPGHKSAFTFPAPERLAALEESDLRACKMGFRAKGLLGTSRIIASGKLNLQALGQCSHEAARTQLTALPGVGPKIADCVLLFAYGFQQAFPIDVWVMRALRTLYFPKRKPTAARLNRFVATYFGLNPGYAQQYLFHYVRTRGTLPAPISNES